MTENERKLLLMLAEFLGELIPYQQTSGAMGDAVREAVRGISTEAIKVERDARALPPLHFNDGYHRLLAIAQKHNSSVFSMELLIQCRAEVLPILAALK